jgi:hypothetical protein
MKPRHTSVPVNAQGVFAEALTSALAMASPTYYPTKPSGFTTNPVSAIMAAFPVLTRRDIPNAPRGRK